MFLNIMGTQQKTENEDDLSHEYDYLNQMIDGFLWAGLVVETLDQDFACLPNCPL